MTTESNPEPVQHSVVVAAPVERAYGVFTSSMARWWPPAYTFAGEDEYASVVVEQFAGGRWYERDISGNTADWGKVLECDVGQRIVLTWQVSAERSPEPPERASTIEVRFVAAGPAATRVELEHRDFDRHGAGAATIRGGMASPQGWPHILERYRTAV